MEKQRKQAKNGNKIRICIICHNQLLLIVKINEYMYIYTNTYIKYFQMSKRGYTVNIYVYTQHYNN